MLSIWKLLSFEKKLGRSSQPFDATNIKSVATFLFGRKPPKGGNKSGGWPITYMTGCIVMTGTKTLVT